MAENPGAISRAGISARTGLNRSTTSSLVDELIDGGLVREAGETARAGVGRPGTALALRPDGPAGLGLGLGAEHAEACVVDLTGRIRFCGSAPGDRRETGRLLRSALAAAEAGGLTLCGTQVAVAGHIDGPLRDGPRIDVPHLGVLCLPGAAGPVTVDGEANLAALAEDELVRAEESYLYVCGNSGIGAGLVVDGRLYRGRHRGSGEIGHVRIDPNGPACRCGRRGCLEKYAGQEAILRSCGIPPAVGARDAAALVKDRAAAADPATLTVLARAGTILGGVLAGYLNLLDLDRIVLGGVYRELSPWIAPEVERAIATQFLGTRWGRPAVVDATYGVEAPALGAARSAVREVLADPLGWLTRRAAGGRPVTAAG